MRDLRATRARLRAEINLTPLVDVVLVLLIIFMVVTPLLARGRAVELPRARTALAETSSQPALVLTIDADKQLLLDDRPVALAELGARLRGRHAAHGALRIKADARLTVRDLEPVLLALKAENVLELGLAVLGGSAP